MNADLEAAIAEGRRRMKQFEDKTSHQIDMFDREVDNCHHKLGHKYSNINEDLKPVSWPLWGVVLETSSGQQIYKDHVSFDQVAKCPRHCACTSHLSARRPMGVTSYIPSLDIDSYSPPVEVDSYTSSIEREGFIPSIEAKTIIEGRRWGLNKYLYDDDYVSNPPYGIIMKKPTKVEPPPRHPAFGDELEKQPNTKLVSQYWRRKWKIPKDW